MAASSSVRWMCILGLTLGESNGHEVWISSSWLGRVCRVVRMISVCLDRRIFQNYLGMGVSLDKLRISMFRINNVIGDEFHIHILYVTS